MSLLLQRHHNFVELLDAQHIIPALTLAVSVVWLAAELFSMPRSRKQLDIPKGDWLSVSLGILPVLGMAATVVWQYLNPATTFRPVLIAPAVILCAAGIGLRTWSKLVLGRFYTFSIGLADDHRLLDEGPYRYVRHPLYLGTFLAVAGMPLLTQSWATVWFLSVPAALAYSLRLVREEAYLAVTLGSDYRAYARRTACLIPFVW